MSCALDTFSSRTTLAVDDKNYHYFSLAAASQNGLGDIQNLPYSLKVLLENLLRHEDGQTVTEKTIKDFIHFSLEKKKEEVEVSYYPARVVMQDFTGVPAVVDLAVMRDAVVQLRGNPQRVNPQVPVDLVIDHSVQVDYFGRADALKQNVSKEYQRNKERYRFLKWGALAFENFRVVPPGVGIVHQVNLEYLAKTVWVRPKDGEDWAFFDTCVGTDSHTTMVNGISVLGWGVGGIEAEAAMLGRPVTMMVPKVVGFYLEDQLSEGVTATDLVLRVVQMLRQEGVVGKFVEFYGPGLDHLSAADRATLANMAPEYGATCGFFPIDQETLNYLRLTGRDDHQILLVERYAKAQGVWREWGQKEGPKYSSRLSLSLSEVVSSLAGYKRPQDRIDLKEAKDNFRQSLRDSFQVKDLRSYSLKEGEKLSDGDVVIAAITSCTNTSNPSVMLAAGLLAKKAVERGLTVKSWVKTSLAPGSRVVDAYLARAGLLKPLEQLGFYVVGYGCTTCIGNSGPLPPEISKAVEEGGLVVTSVLSGNRNFEGRISPQVKANFLASPPLVVAYALAGSLNVDLLREPLGIDTKGKEVYLKDIWPKDDEIKKALTTGLSKEMFQEKYQDVFSGDEDWTSVGEGEGETYDWKDGSTYVRRPPYFEGISFNLPVLEDITGARALAILGDSVTTDHISPAGAIGKTSPAGKFLQEKGIPVSDFNSYGSRRGNHQVMIRGTFANIRLKNLMVPGVEGGVTKFWPGGEQLSIFDAAIKYAEQGTPLVVVAGREYGTGSSRDWAAKGTNLLGVVAVIAESFERIHRSNLVGMGVLPLQLPDGVTRESLQLSGQESFNLFGIKDLSCRGKIKVVIEHKGQKLKEVLTDCRIDTRDELDYYRHGGILHYVLRSLAKQ